MKKVDGQPEPAVGQHWRTEFRGIVRELIRFERRGDTEWAVLYTPSVPAPHKVVAVEAWKLGMWPWQWRIYTPESEEKLAALRERRRQLAAERRRRAAESGQRFTRERCARVGSWWQNLGQVAQIVSQFTDDKGTLRVVMDWGEDAPQTYPAVETLTADYGWAETEPQPHELAGPRFGL